MLKRALFSIFVFAITLFSASFAVAQIDDSSRNLLIEKLDKVYLNLAPKDASKVAVTLRLADLYAERARISSMKELDQGCTTCVAGDADRKKALRLYNEVLDRAPEGAQGKIMVQVGHLYQMTGAEDKAIGFYQQIINGNNSPDLKTEASLSLGEIYFKRRDFHKAQAYYKEVLKNPTAVSRGLAAYRNAWSSFNLGNTEEAISEIEQVLKTPALLTRNGANGAQIDAQFHDEVSRDYATFLSKAKIDKQRVETLYRLSPETARTANVQSLALDAERMGKKAEALSAWTFVYGYLNKPEDRLSAQVTMAQLHFDLGDKKAALASFESGLNLAREMKACTTSQCEELRRRSRQFVVNWNQTEKKTPSAELLTAYKQFLATYPEDIDMNIYAALVAKEQGDFKTAASYNAKAANLLAKDPKEAKKLETVLLSQIEVGEASKDDALMTAAYDSYLALSVAGTKSFDVKYQKARDKYEKGQYGPASEELRSLAMTKNGDMKIRKQAADLSLDALVLMKDESKIGTWAAEYATVLGSDKAGANDFSQIAQKSVLTKSASMAGSNTEAAYGELLKFKVADASQEDKTKYYKNKLILAEKLKRFPEAQSAADDLLRQPGLSAEDQEFAWARKAYMAEMMLDFATAMAATEKLQTTLKPDEKALKLALMADLSGKISAPYYGQYLKVSKDDENKKLVAAELVRKSKSPEKEIESYKPYLEKSPHLMAQLYSETFAKTSSSGILNKVVKDAKLKNTDSGKLMARVAFLKEFEAFQGKLASHKLDSANDKKLAASIKARAALLDKLEAMTKSAIQEGDWTSQLVSIDLLAKESDRFYQELISAPMPQGLTAEEENEYLNLLSAQAAPFQTKAAEAKGKVEQFWKNSNWMPSLKASWEQRSLRSLIAVEVAALAKIAPSEYQGELASFDANKSEAVVAKTNRPSIQEVQAARSRVHQDPMNVAALKNLQTLEQKSDNVAMVQYLQTRIDNLNKGIQ